MAAEQLTPEQERALEAAIAELVKDNPTIDQRFARAELLLAAAGRILGVGNRDVREVRR